MKHLLPILLFFAALPVMAQNLITASGNVTELPTPAGVDHVFIFADLTSAQINASATATWYKYDNGTQTQIQTGVDYLYPEDNTGYIVEIGTQTVSFFVIDYSKHLINIRSLTPNLEYENRCEYTELLVDADIPQLEYRLPDGRKREITREAQVTYTSLGWDGEQWQDSLCSEQVTMRERIIVGAPLRNTVFTIGADQFMKELSLTIDSVTSDLYEAVAVDARPTTITTVRGDENENQRTNEIERPIETTQLQGSAPLDILFRANANAPVAQYYQWKIYKGTQLVVQRTDDQHRYTFQEYGQYRVVLVVSNDYCATDSTSIDVSVSLSQLLVPNVFTPNGDGRNDEFRVSYRSIIEFECWVYDRWGHLVYHWNDPAKGWDGTVNGRPAAEGAYFYIIRAKGADAEAGAKYRRATAKKPAEIGVYQLSGDINLIRGERK